ncbi:hypothetical protein ACFCYF_39475 [Streptomyces chartreusis]|uniref:hypothetical protein n=1 Tax=Streptomyces chartreusis TaxID=1969 RepID=UPI002E80455C|nr:hypothetical protein [Streptomyces chartreusis]WUB18698.1 hypothetical protein OG997_19115 [Streptomyces chartreusis]
MDLETVADELYRLRPEEFTATRAARMAEARTAGDRALADSIGKLRRPSLSAWAGNLLVHESPGEVEPLLRLGEGLRQAHRDLDGAQLRELSRQQRVLITALSRQAGQLAAQAGHPITEAARHEVENTLRAVLADPDAAREWASGRLVKPLAAGTGFPAMAEGAAPAPPRPAARTAGAAKAAKSTGASKAAAAERRRRLTRARKEADRAARELRTREKAAATASREAFAAKKNWDEAQQRVSDLTAELQHAREAQQQARSAEQTARERARAADRGVREARRKADAAAEEAQRLETPEQ